MPRQERKEWIDWEHLRIGQIMPDFPARSVNTRKSLLLSTLYAPGVVRLECLNKSVFKGVFDLNSEENKNLDHSHI